MNSRLGANMQPERLMELEAEEAWHRLNDSTVQYFREHKHM